MNEETNSAVEEKRQSHRYKNVIRGFSHSPTIHRANPRLITLSIARNVNIAPILSPAENFSGRPRSDSIQHSVSWQQLLSSFLFHYKNNER